jgi:hypothetical protein
MLLQRIEPEQGLVRQRVLVLDVRCATGRERLASSPGVQPGRRQVVDALDVAHDSSGTPSTGDDASA